MLCTWQHFRAKEELERRGARRGSDGQQGVVAPAPACGDCARVPRILGSSDTGQAFLVFTACTALISANRTFTVLKCALCHHTFTILNQKPSTFTLPPPYARHWDTRVSTRFVCASGAHLLAETPQSSQLPAAAAPPTHVERDFDQVENDRCHLIYLMTELA